MADESELVYKVTLFTAEGFITEYVRGGSIIIGSSPSADLKLEFKGVSRKHIQVYLQDEDIFIKDQGSMNGTYLKSKRIPVGQPVLYKQRQGIKLGPRTDFEMSIELIREEKSEKFKAFKIVDEAKKLKKTIKREMRELQDKTKKQLTQWQKHVREEVDKNKERAESKSRKILSEADQKAQTTVLEAEAEAERIKKDSIHEADQILKDAKEESEKLIRRANEDYDQISSENEKIQAEFRASKKELADHEAELERINITSESVRECISELESELEELAERFKREESEFEVLKRRNKTELEGQEAELTLNLKKIAVEIEEAHAKKVIAENDLDRVYLKRSQLEEEYEDKLEKIENFESKLREFEDRRSSLIGEISGLESQKDGYGDDLREAREEISKAEERANDIIRESEKIRKKAIRTLEEAEGIQREKLEEVEIERQKVQEELNQIRKEAELERSQILEKSKEVAQKETARQRRKLESREADLDKRRQKHNEDVKQRLKAIELEKTRILEDAQKVLRQNKEQSEKIIYEAKRKSSERLESVSEEAESIIAEAKTKSEQMLQEARDQSDGIMSNVEQEGRAKAVELKEELRKVREQFEKESRSQKARFDKELARMRLKEVDSANERMEEREKEYQERRQKEIDTISRNILMRLKTRLNDFGNGKANEEKTYEMLDEVHQIISKVMNFESADNELDLQEALNFDPTSAKSKKDHVNKFKKIAMTAVAAIALVLVSPYVLDYSKKLFLKVVGKSSAQEEYVKKVQKIRDNKPKFDPETTSEFKESYVKNVLYTTNYLQLKLSKEYKDKWIVNLNDFVLEKLKLKEEVLLEVITLENKLLEDLKRMRAGINPAYQQKSIARMEIEQEKAESQLRYILKSRKNYKKFKNFRKDFFENYRSLASEKKDQ